MIGIGACKMPPPAKGTRKHAAPTKLHKALVRGVMRGGGGTKGRAVLIMPLNEHRTTKCCSRCGGETGAAKVEWRGEVRDSNRWRECAAWNLWEVAVAQYWGLPRPAYLTRQGHQ